MPEVNSRNLKVQPIEEYYIKDENLKYTEKPIINYGRLFFDLKRIMLKGTKKEKEKAADMYDEYLFNFLTDHSYVPEGYVGSKYAATEKFLNKYPEECYRRRRDYAGNEYRELMLSPTGVNGEKGVTEEEYNKAIREWESDIRKGLIEDLGESWCWNDDRTKGFGFYVNYFPKVASPVKIPSWMFATNTFNEIEFHMDDIEKVALAHAICFTLPPYKTGYYECSGHVERWCRCDVETVHHTFQKLFDKRLVCDISYGSPDVCNHLTRNWGWRANIVYIQQVLSNYGREIDK